MIPPGIIRVRDVLGVGDLRVVLGVRTAHDDLLHDDRPTGFEDAAVGGCARSMVVPVGLHDCLARGCNVSASTIHGRSVVLCTH